MWTFYVELAEIVEEAEGTDYPNLMFVHGQLPDTAPEKHLKLKIWTTLMMNLRMV